MAYLYGLNFVILRLFRRLGFGIPDAPRNLACNFRNLLCIQSNSSRTLTPQLCASGRQF